VCKAKGYNCVIYMPNTQSPDKMVTLRALGATVNAVPAVPFSDPNNYNHQVTPFISPCFDNLRPRGMRNLRRIVSGEINSITLPTVISILKQLVQR
jgi:hypothetical protein